MNVSQFTRIAAGFESLGVAIPLIITIWSMSVAYQAIASASASDMRICISRSQGVTSAMQSCQSREYDRLDRTLNKTYKKVMAQLRTRDLRTRLVQSQRVWIWRRDEDCKAKIKSSAVYGGSAAELMYQDCRIKLVRDRIEWLTKVPKNPGYLAKV